jgi:hypothetical protein
MSLRLMQQQERNSYQREERQPPNYGLVNPATAARRTNRLTLSMISSTTSPLFQLHFYVSYCASKASGFVQRSSHKVKRLLLSYDNELRCPRPYGSLQQWSTAIGVFIVSRCLCVVLQSYFIYCAKIFGKQFLELADCNLATLKP